MSSMKSRSFPEVPLVIFVTFCTTLPFSEIALFTSPRLLFV
jgi:hypothetical protein